jgi:V8-like Glu-specific endopeptidase
MTKGSSLLLAGLLAIAPGTIAIQSSPVGAVPPSSDSSDGFLPEGSKPSSNPSGGRQIIGRDDRVPVLSREYPWRAIGRVDIYDKKTEEFLGHCTGTLIGVDLVLTNAHCVIDQKTHKLGNRIWRFRPNLIDGEAQDTAIATRVAYGTDFKDEETSDKDDWALLKINKPLGNRYGYLGWRSIDSKTLVSNFKGKISIMGYSGDFPKSNPGETAGYSRGCSFLRRSEVGTMFHNCDTNPGASGSAVLTWINGKPYVVGLHSGSNTFSTGEKVNRAVEVARWGRTAKSMR